LQALVRGFKGSALFPIVAVLAFTGARRSEVLALRWEDIDVSRKTLRIERAIEQTKRYGLRLKGPKRKSTSARSRLPSVTDIGGLSPAFPTRAR
jgi:integrase